MKASDPAGWATLAAEMNMAKANHDALSACREAASSGRRRNNTARLLCRCRDLKREGAAGGGATINGLRGTHTMTVCYVHRVDGFSRRHHGGLSCGWATVQYLKTVPSPVFAPKPPPFGPPNSVVP